MDAREAITRAAEEDGVDPAFALAVAQRESRFNPNARNSKTIYGLYQMKGSLRNQYGSGDSPDPYTQAKAWNRFQDDVRSEMSPILGRDPTDEETYMGHYFGGARAARMISKYDPNMPVADVFTPQERQGNPEFDQAGTIGPLMANVSKDIATRKQSFGGEPSGEASAFNPSQYGTLVGDAQGSAPSAENFSQYGTLVQPSA